MKTLLFLLVSIILPVFCLGQEDQLYYDSLLTVIQERENLSDASFQRLDFKNGNIRSQGLFVRLTDEKSWYLFRPGIVDRFYRNGQHKYHGVCDLQGYMIKTKKWYRNGNLKEVRDYSFSPDFDTKDLFLSESHLLPLQGWYQIDYRKNGKKKSEGYFYQVLTKKNRRSSLKHGTHLTYDQKGEQKSTVFSKGIKE